MDFLFPFRQMTELQHKLGHDFFLLHLFQFIIYYHPAIQQYAGEWTMNKYIITVSMANILIYIHA
jgi:hypothetical protein